MNNNEITSPCITVCKTDPISGYCYGCGRSLEDKKLWSNPDIDNEKKIENLKVIRNRLNGWQKTAFDLSGKGYYGLGCEFALSKSQPKVNSNIEVLDGKFMTVKKSHVDLNNLRVPQTNTVVYRSAVPPTPQPTASASAN